ncbi:DUF5133 domain-containing protein [Streptomyces lunaelactis]|uniref:DUF5133 domain-containing protein n=1 Tax=Streptomyces lunaelactis TaxID=1535768 RepID=UPI0034D97614
MRKPPCLPSESVITEVLGKYQLWERGMLRDPPTLDSRARFQDAAYTCVSSCGTAHRPGGGPCGSPLTTSRG